jgi:hypothetical protein
MQQWIANWTEHLIDLTSDDFKRAFSASLSQYPKFPPTLPEFRALAKPHSAPEHRSLPRLPSPEKASKSTQAHAMSRYRGMIKSVGLRRAGKEWMTKANEKTISILRMSQDPNAPEIIRQIMLVNPELALKLGVFRERPDDDSWPPRLE